tara:strand:- start:123 stop:770 length:648 start_codon:yes stop_codon:yes gene_type:complete
MYKKNFFFIVFEGIEGCGKSFQSKKLFKNLKKKGFSVDLTREPGGTKSAEQIRDLILKDYFFKDSKEKFHKYTDTLLYMAARNEHFQNRIKKSIVKKNILICDRFIDSTIAYQVYGKGVDIKFVNLIHKKILGKIKPNVTILLKVKISKALKRLKKRVKKNRYDKFSKNFYVKAQKSFIKIAQKNRKTHIILNSSEDNSDLEKDILNIIMNKIKR